MAKIMVLAESGFGKTSSLGANPALGIKGLVPSQTLIIQSTRKGLPFPGNKKNYTPVGVAKDASGNNVLIGNLFFAADHTKAIDVIRKFLQFRPEIVNFVLDDFNFYMQDYYMNESKQKKNAFKVFEDIGGQTSDFFSIFDAIDAQDKNVIVLAHSEIYEDLEGRKRFKMKTVGSMVDKYVTPEGRFEIVLLGKANIDMESKKVSKSFVTNDDGMYNGKTPYGMFNDLYIPNDMGLVIDTINQYNNG